jgi:hypothetical protein
VHGKASADIGCLDVTAVMAGDVAAKTIFHAAAAVGEHLERVPRSRSKAKMGVLHSHLDPSDPYSLRAR